MLDASADVRAQRMGCIAHGILKKPNVGRVTAVFSAVFYIEISSEVIAFGHQGIDPHPLLVTLDVSATEFQKMQPQIGDSVEVSKGIVRVANTFVFTTSDAELWSPPRPLVIQLEAGLAALAKTSAAPPAEGYGSTVRDTMPGVPEIAAAERAIRDHLNGRPLDISAFVPLLGRGPGLTPSGDDVLGGILIALYALGHAETAKEIWRGLLPLVPERTHAISAAMLKVAAQGQGSGALHKAMNALFEAKNLPSALAALSLIGHSSGWDAFAGVVLAARVVHGNASQAPKT